MMRLLGIIRLSDFRETSISPQQQRKIMEDYAKSHGHTIIAFVEDDDTSGVYGPFHPKRSFGLWLTDRSSEFDGIICRAINRVARNAEQTLRLIRWAENRHKILISIKDGIDTTSDAGNTMAKFMAIVAEMELDQIKSRAQDGHKHLTQVALRWRGMSVPFGYRPYCIVCLETTQSCSCQPSARKGYKLEPDPTYAPILASMVDRFLAGASLGQIVQWLNDSKVPTSSDIAKIRYGKRPANAKWTSQSVRKILTSHAMLGAMDTTEVLERDDETGEPTKRSNRKALRDENGDLILRAEPIVSYDKWSKVQARLNSNPQVGKPHVNASPLLHVAYCGISGDPMYIATSHDRRGNRSFRYYLCRMGNHGECAAKRFDASWLEDYIQREILATVGNQPYMMPHIVPAEEYSDALRQTEDAITNLLEALEAGAFKGRMDVFQERMDNLEARKAELEAKPSSPERRTWLPTGKTVSDHWSMLTQDQRWDFLRAMNVRAYVSRKGERMLPASLETLTEPYRKPGQHGPGNVPRLVVPSDDDDKRVFIFFGTLADMMDAYLELASKS
jgi:site-specific DNA recombinase